jgi:cytochrome c-type biogenesis protein CcmH
VSLAGFFVAALGAVLVALAFVLLPLFGGQPERRALRRRLDALDELADELDSDDYQARRAKLEAAIGDEKNASGGPQWALIAGLALAIPLATWLLYQAVGEPEGIDLEDSQVEQIRGVLRELAREVERNPDNVDNWVRLGLSYKDLAEHSSAEHALRRALYIDPNNPFIQVELAETLLFSSDGARLPEASRLLLENAVARDPGNQKGLWLLGMGDFQAGDYRGALENWQRLDAALEPGSVQNSVRQQIQRARAALDGSGPPDGRLPPDHPPIDTQASDGANGPGFMVEVSIDPTLAAELDGTETVFLIARAAEGPAAPLAVRRFVAGDLPANLTLRDSDAMVDGLNLSSFPEITLTARVSMAGTAEARPGDFEGRLGPISILDVASAQIRIDTTLD